MKTNQAKPDTKCVNEAESWMKYHSYMRAGQLLIFKHMEELIAHIREQEAKEAFMANLHKDNDVILASAEKEIADLKAQLVTAQKQAEEIRQMISCIGILAEAPRFGVSDATANLRKISDICEQALAEQDASPWISEPVTYEHDLEEVKISSEKIKLKVRCKKCEKEWYADDHPERTYDCKIPTLPQDDKEITE